MTAVSSLLTAARFLLTAVCFLLSGCEGNAGDSATAPSDTWEPLVLRYAEQFTVDYDQTGRALVTIAGTDRFLLVPAETTNEEISADTTGTPDGVTVLSVPLDNLYVASSSAMDFFSRLDALDTVAFTSTPLNGWSLAPVRAAMEAGTLRFAGKYSAPDVELLFSSGCSLAVENTMITHSPDIREQLEALGISVLVERSSYESHPLGRVEWVKLYGILTGREAEAAAFFDQQAEAVERIASDAATGKTAAFFSFSSNGSVIVRKPGDYVAKMIAMAGGRYVLSDILPEADTALSTVNLQMEAFYARARDADILIYNGTIDGGMETMEQLLGKSELAADFKAVRNGQVWCTERNLFQETTAAAGMIADLHAIFNGTAARKLTYFHQLE